VRRLPLLIALAALPPVATGHADSQSFTLSTGYNETSLTSGLNRGTAFQAQIARGHRLFRGSLDSRGLASFGLGRIASSYDFDCQTTRYPVITVFARAGEGSGVALDLHQDWYSRGTPTRAPGKHVTMFQTQGGISFQDGEAPKVRVSHRFVTSQRRFPGRTQGVEWVWEFRHDYPAYYSRGVDRGEMTPMLRRSMRAENWAFFSRELGAGVVRVNVGATHKTVTRVIQADDAATTPIDQITRRGGTSVRRVPVLMVRLAYEVRRW
jgi:hypothetical protein